MHLVRIELRRLAHRRLAWAALALIPLVAGLAGVTTWRSHSAAAPDYAAAEIQAERQERECRASMAGEDIPEQQLHDMCFLDPAWLVEDRRFPLQRVLGGEGRAPWPVAMAALARHEIPVPPDGLYVGPTESPATGRGGLVPGTASLAMLIVIAATAAHLGAEWRDRTIESQLVWEPRRTRLFGAKLAAVSLAAAAYAFVFVGASVLAVLPAAHWRGTTAHTGPWFWADSLVTGGRIAAVAAVLAAITAGVTFVFRSAAAAVVALFGFAVVGMILAQTSLPFTGHDLFSNVSSWVKTSDVTRWVSVRTPDGGSASWMEVSHGWWMAGGLILAYALIAVVSSVLAFERRDIT